MHRPLPLPLSWLFHLLFLVFCFETGRAQEKGTPSVLPELRYRLTARPWVPSGVSGNDFLEKVEGVVRVTAGYQNAAGAIIDPYAKREVQYATPYFANAVGTLLKAGRAMDLLQKGVAAMNKATLDVSKGVEFIPDKHGEFFLAALANAIPLYEPFVSAAQVQLWKTRMGKPVGDVIKGGPNNWRAYAMKGEWYRAKNGYVNKSGAVNWIEDNWVKTQRSRMRNNSWRFYHDNTCNPDTWPYEAVARASLLAMIADGYDGASRSEMLSYLRKGTQSSLLLQDPSGQVAAGGRSGNHTWNDILLANGYEIMAEMAYKEGNLHLAGQYRRAAGLAFQSAQRWRRSDGSYSVTKNHFDPVYRIRYAHYSFFTNYNGNMMYHMAENFLRRKSAIPEQPTPSEIGGYTLVTDTTFATAVANAGGMYMEVCLRGSAQLDQHYYWTALGVVRFARSGWDSRLGPSDGVRDSWNRLGVSFAPTFPEGGSWVRLASVPERYEAVFSTQFAHPLLVRCQVVYKPKQGASGPTFTNDFVITPDGVLSKLTSTAAQYGITWPLLMSDGATTLSTKITAYTASNSFPGTAD